MMKAAAPIMGGVTMPPVDAVDSTPAENSGEYPNFFIIGMVKLPVVATSSGTVKEVRCNKGDAVEADAVLIVLE